MDSQPALPLWSPSSAHPTQVGLRDALVTLLALLLPAVAALMLIRRAIGALAVPADAPLIVATALVATAAAIAIHRAIRSLPSGSGVNSVLNVHQPKQFPGINSRPLPRNFSRAADVAADAALAAIAISLSIPGSSLPAIAILWLAVVAETGWSQTRRHSGLPRSPTAAPIDASLADESETSPWSDLDCTQHLEYRTEGGRLAVSGWTRADFSAGERTAVIHAAFCPAFEHPPHVEAEILDGPSCRLRATLILPWGIRWELKLDDPAEAPANVILGFTANQPPNDPPLTPDP